MRRTNVTTYLDSSFLIPLLIPEAFSDRADAFVEPETGPFGISDLTGMEFASAMARRIRIQLFDVDKARSALLAFDRWVARAAIRNDITVDDLALASSFLRRLDLPLRTLDALHIAIAQRIGATLITFDNRMADSARVLGIPVAVP